VLSVSQRKRTPLNHRPPRSEEAHSETGGDEQTVHESFRDAAILRIIDILESVNDFLPGMTMLLAILACDRSSVTGNGHRDLGASSCDDGTRQIEGEAIDLADRIKNNVLGFSTLSDVCSPALYSTKVASSTFINTVLGIGDSIRHHFVMKSGLGFV